MTGRIVEAADPLKQVWFALPSEYIAHCAADERNEFMSHRFVKRSFNGDVDDWSRHRLTHPRRKTIV